MNTTHLARDAWSNLAPEVFRLLKHIEMLREPDTLELIYTIHFSDTLSENYFYLVKHLIDWLKGTD